MTDFTPAAVPFTGRRMLAAILLFFGVIIAVNATMLTLAVRNFGGLVVPNSYIASQRFNDDVAATRAQALQQWSVGAEASGDTLSVRVTDAGVPVEGLALSAVATRPTHERTLQSMTLTETAPGRYTAQPALAPGIWSLTLTTGDGQRRALSVVIRSTRP